MQLCGWRRRCYRSCPVTPVSFFDEPASSGKEEVPCVAECGQTLRCFTYSSNRCHLGLQMVESEGSASAMCPA